jgi:hypothetical protein
LAQDTLPKIEGYWGKLFYYYIWSVCPNFDNNPVKLNRLTSWNSFLIYYLSDLWTTSIINYGYLETKLFNSIFKLGYSYPKIITSKDLIISLLTWGIILNYYINTF